jgi:hypothetical protein
VILNLIEHANFKFTVESHFDDQSHSLEKIKFRDPLLVLSLSLDQRYALLVLIFDYLMFSKFSYCLLLIPNLCDKFNDDENEGDFIKLVVGMQKNNLLSYFDLYSEMKPFLLQSLIFHILYFIPPIKNAIRANEEKKFSQIQMLKLLIYFKFILAKLRLEKSQEIDEGFIIDEL